MTSDLSDRVTSRAQLLTLWDHLHRLHQSHQRFTERWRSVLSVDRSLSQGDDDISDDDISDDDQGESYTINLEILRDQINSNTPLKLLLLGGSGVGKSTLINTLAGSEISSASGLTRAHTSGLIIYTHPSWRAKSLAELAPSWPPELLKVCERVDHDRAALKDIWIIDAPDVDSVKSIHRKRTLTALSEIDLPMVVTSPQKYRDESYLSALEMIDARRSLIFVMNQIDMVWPEQREELMIDAQGLSSDLGFKEMSWIGVDARDDSVQSISHSSGLKSSLQTSMGMKAIRELLEVHLDHKESERLRSARFAQRLSELLQGIKLSPSICDELDQLQRWRTQLIELIIPSLTQYLRMSHELRLLEAERQAKFDVSERSKLWVSWPLQLCWSLMIRGSYDADKVRILESEQRSAYLRCRSSFLRHVRELPHALLASSDTQYEMRDTIDQALTRYQNTNEPISSQLSELSGDEITRLGYRQLGFSVTFAIILGSVTSWNLIYILMTLAMSAWIFARWTLNHLRLQRGQVRSVQPLLSTAATEVALQLGDQLLSKDKRWSALILSQPKSDARLDYEHFRIEREQYRRKHEDLSHHLSIVLLDHTHVSTLSNDIA